MLQRSHSIFVRNLRLSMLLLLGVAITVPAFCADANVTVSAPATSASEADSELALQQLLSAQRLDIALTNGKLSGVGAQWVFEQSATAQFILVGEDHGMAEAAQFSGALFAQQAAIKPNNLQHLVIETGPWSAAQLETAARKGSKALAQLEARFPTAIPFFGWQQDGALALDAVRGNTTETVLWGIDQEFLLAGRILFQQLLALAPNDKAKQLAQKYLDQATANYQTMLKDHNPEIATFNALAAADFQALRATFTNTAPALDIISGIEESAKIYRTQNSNGPASNAARLALMKRNFMYYYQAALKHQQQPRALFRLGAFHAGRGLSPLGLFDVGNLASELANSQGSHSLHILVIAAGGQVNRWFPFIPDAALKHSDYNAKEELGVMGAVPFLSAASNASWGLFPTAKLRNAAAKIKSSGGTAFEHLIFNYDAVLVVPKAVPAVNYPR